MHIQIHRYLYINTRPPPHVYIYVQSRQYMYMYMDGWRSGPHVGTGEELVQIPYKWAAKTECAIRSCNSNSLIKWGQATLGCLVRSAPINEARQWPHFRGIKGLNLIVAIYHQQFWPQWDSARPLSLMQICPFSPPPYTTGSPCFWHASPWMGVRYIGMVMFIPFVHTWRAWG